MKILSTLPCLLLFSISPVAGDRGIPINDVSLVGSPLRNHGVVKVAQEPSGDASMMSSSQDWTVKNVSGKAIVALSESLSCVYPDGRKGARIERYETFFHSNVMKPGDELSFSEPPRTIERSSKFNPGSAEPKCDAKVLWVQFVDGSIFGDKEYGDPLIADRRATLKGLNHLRSIYLQGDQDQFVQTIQGPPDPNSALSYVNLLDQLKTDYKESRDIEHTYNRLKAYIDTAETRHGLLD